MKAGHHIKILSIVSAVWVIFWLIGWPAYYRQYSFRFMLIFDAAILLPLWFVLYRVLKSTPPHRRSALCFWLAFYITVPLFLYDCLYCGIYLKYGWAFLHEFWYLSVYYLIPWIICPVTVIWLRRSGPENTVFR